MIHKEDSARGNTGKVSAQLVAGPPPGERRQALITGPTAGIGRVFAEKLAASGHDLIAVARDEARLDALARELGDRFGAVVEPFPADLSSDDETSRVVERIARHAPLDVLVNNAGFGSKGRLVDADPRRQDAMLHVHVVAPMRIAQAALAPMLARGSGAIINVSSIASFTASPGNVNYCATKAYLRVFSEALALEVEGRGVVVQALCPGFTHTEFHDRAHVSKGRIPKWMWMTPEKVVDDSLAAVKKGGPVVVVPGIGYRALVGMLKYAPEWVRRRGTKRYRRDA